MFNQADLKRLLFLPLLFILSSEYYAYTAGEEEEPKDWKYLSVEDYRKAVYASWIGQIVGNTYGLCYEFKYIGEPGPDDFPYGYSWTLDTLKKYNGAFSDDDTDIEYMYLTQMEKYGIEPTYAQLTEAWKTHVKTKVWCANRAALTLMLAGHYPPVTGSKTHNPQWCQIDPQLVNEIWAVTAPGMISYAVSKSEFAARITSDSFGLEPTLHYAAMYSAAFFEKDIHKLIDTGTAALPDSSRFAQIVAHVKDLHARYPDDWQEARRIVKENYLTQADYNQYVWPVIDANLNGAFGIMALLYGEGDFRKTLDYCCAFGMDADNQAATMCGLLGLVNGLDAIPEDLLYPIENAGWVEPFNDVYRMISREGLDDARISDMARRIADQGEQIILAYGGKIVDQNGTKNYLINTQTEFVPPFELNPFPDLYAETGIQFSYSIYTGGREEEIDLSTEGMMPPGIELVDGRIIGRPSQKGIYNFIIIARAGMIEKTQPVKIVVHSENLAGSAIRILFNQNSIHKNIGIIRDGATRETYYSIKADDQRETDFYGYLWNKPVNISALVYNNGIPHEYCGWFTTFDVEYLWNDQWIKIENLRIYPELNLENTQWLKPYSINYEISFPAISTRGIRIIGLAGGLPKDAANAHLGLQYYTSISELRVY